MLPDIPYANSSWFTFLITGSAGSAPFAVYEFSGTERLNEPFEFAIEFVARDSNLPTTTFLGKVGVLSISDRSGGKRHVHGLIRQMLQLHTGNRFTHYRCLLVPRLWFLKETVEHKIFQHQTVAQIIREVLRNQRFIAEEYSLQLHGKYPEREYCTQYGESDLHFLSRLCEEEGITYYFEHSEAGHRLIFSDVPGGPPIPGQADLRFFPGSGNPADTAVIARLTHQQRINSDSASYREWNFTTPKIDLTVNKREPDWEKAPAPQVVKMESYRYPHLYQTKAEGERYAEIQLLRQLTYREWIEGEGDVSRLTPGIAFCSTAIQG
jgi:type VI secretion system secreted protein VgrG